MKKALVDQSGRIAQIVAPGDEFDVHGSLSWVDVADTVTDRDRFEAGAVVKEAPPAPAMTAAGIYDEILTGNPVLAALIGAVNAGAVGAAGQGKTPAALKAEIVGRMK